MLILQNCLLPFCTHLIAVMHLEDAPKMSSLPEMRTSVTFPNPAIDPQNEQAASQQPGIGAIRIPKCNSEPHCGEFEITFR